MIHLLQGQKVKLRAMEPLDIDLILQWENNTANWKVSGTTAPFSRDTIKQYVENAPLDVYKAGQLRLMIEELQTGRAVGTMDLFDFDAFNQRTGLGILIAEEADRNRGWGKDALLLIKDYCFNHFGLKQLHCTIHTDNLSSLKLFQSVGFEINGTQKSWQRYGREFKDVYFLQLLKD